MKAEPDEDMLPEYDFSAGVRGRYASRMTAAEREELQRRAAYEMVREVSSYALQQVRSLEAAIFTFFVLARHEPVQNAARYAAVLLDRSEPSSAVAALHVLSMDAHTSRDLPIRLRKLKSERNWLAEPREDVYEGPGSFNPLMERLDAIYREAVALRSQVETLIEEHLSASGLSKCEIDRKADETAKLWLAA